MVSGFLFPFVGFIDVSYSVYMKGAAGVEDDDLWHHHIGRFSPFFLFSFNLRASWEGVRAS